MGYFICVLVGICLVLTVENTIILHRKPKEQPPTVEDERKAEKEKRDAEEWESVMNYHGRDKS